MQTELKVVVVVVVVNKGVAQWQRKTHFTAEIHKTDLYICDSFEGVNAHLITEQIWYEGCQMIIQRNFFLFLHTTVDFLNMKSTFKYEIWELLIPQ